MDDLDWLVEREFKELVRHEFSWSFIFDDGAYVTTECLWRLIENGRIRVTSDDDGHQFGLPTPVDAVLRVQQSLAGARARVVSLREGTLDLEIRFDSDHVLQVIPNSCGYESWNATRPGLLIVAVAGGDLAVFRDDKIT